MNEHDEFWEPTRKLWTAIKRFLPHLPDHVRRWMPVILLLILVVELIKVAGTLDGGYASSELYAHVILAAAACIGLGISAAGGPHGRRPSKNRDKIDSK